jgi:uncharacterized membrane protein YozB (DUF420 family)
VPALTLSDLPLVNASLNATSGVLLVFGYISIRRGRVQLHKAAMIAACVVSALFLTSYVIYHANIGSKPFPGRGPIRAVYFAILLTHVILAAAVPPLALITLTRGLRSRFDRHVAIARWTFPIWLYVSVTGVIVYVMLYRMY